MAERRKNKKKKESDIKGIDEKPSKEEYAVARYLKQKLPEKKTTLLGHKVEYFIASRAIDCLVESPWAKENKKGELNFSNRDVALEFMGRLLVHKFFHRAKKIVVQKEPKKKKPEKEEKESESSKEKESKKSKAKSDVIDSKDGKKESEGADKDNKEKDKDNKVKDKDNKDKDKDNKDKDKEKKKEKKKIKLDMHLEQIFIDSNEPYVWIYDPIPLRTWITGTLMVIAAVLLCLFPLWPQTIRHYIYYLSVAAAFFLVFIIGLAFLRLVVFVILWVLTLGKHHLWLLPNLTEDVGFFESFWPLYKYEYKGHQGKGDKEKSSKEDKAKEKDSEEEKEENEAQGEEGKEEEEAGEEKEQSQSEDSQGSDGDAQKTENGFEFLEAEEVSDGEDRKTK